MSITITTENKNTLTVTPEAKPTGGTFGSEATRTFGDKGSFGQPDFFLALPTKTTLTLSNETKL